MRRTRKFAVCVAVSCCAWAGSAACRQSGSGDTPSPPVQRTTSAAPPENTGGHVLGVSADSAHAAVRPWLVDITASTGLRFTHQCGFDGSYHLAEIMGPGCALLDYDNDGDLDVLLIDGGGPPRLDPPADLSNRPVTSRLWRQDANRQFSDVTSAAGLDNRDYGMGCAVADFDNDGDLDIYLTNYGPNRLFMNRGDGTFADVTGAAGVAAGGWSVSAAFFDYDRDGWLDLYVVRYLAEADDTRCRDSAGRPDYCGPASMPPMADVLYRNIGGKRFEDVSKAAGIAAAARRGLGVLTADFDGDGRQDVYVANDGDPNQLWINRGDGSFSDRAYELGAAVNAAGAPEASMGLALGDADHDGAFDVFITNLRGETNTYYRGLGAAGFEDVTARTGLGAPSLPFTGFGTGMVDFDHDGRLDLLVVQGRVTRGALIAGTNLPPELAPYAEPNALFRGVGGGRFEAVGDAAGAGFCDTVAIHRGTAFGDIDGDGDLDVLVSRCAGPAAIFRNDAPKRGRWLMVRAVDPATRRDAIGAVVTVVAGSIRRQGLVSSTGSYASANDARVNFGLGDAARFDRIEITWPDGRRQIVSGGPADRLVIVERREGPT